MGDFIAAAAERAGAFGIGLMLAAAVGVGPAWSQSATGSASAAAPASAAGGPPRVAAAAKPDSQENLTVLGHRRRFETAPMPGPEMGPPPDKPPPHLGRYKISGDQEQKDGYDAQTGAYIAPFGTAYTGASPTAGGLASRYQH